MLYILVRSNSTKANDCFTKRVVVHTINRQKMIIVNHHMEKQ